MKEKNLKALINKIKSGEIDVESALKKLKTLPYEDIGFAKVDNHRGLRQGVPEIIFGEGKTKEQIAHIMDVLVRGGNDAIVTHTNTDVFKHVRKNFEEATYNEHARMIIVRRSKGSRKKKGLILVISAGTSDIPVAEEAAVVAEITGNKVKRLYDVGVAGVHRLLSNIDLIRSATVLIVVAGMEGALPSVVAGLVDKPVIAVPTSVGYGANFGGISALLGMLNSCALGIAVVNIDNGFGAGCVANSINRLHQSQGDPG